MSIRESVITREAAADLKRRIPGEGKISSNGMVLDLRSLNKTPDTGLNDLVAKSLQLWIDETLVPPNRAKTRIGVVEGSGDTLAALVAHETQINEVIFQKGDVNGPPDNMSGTILFRNLSSSRRLKPTPIYVEKEVVHDIDFILVDDFIGGAATAEAVEGIIEEGGGRLIGICAAIQGPGSKSAAILDRYPHKSIIQIDEMRAATKTAPAKVRFADEIDFVKLEKRWGEG